MFSPVVWLQSSMAVQISFPWISWTIFILGLLLTGALQTHWYGRIQGGHSLMGAFLSVMVSLLWPFAIGAIPVIVAGGLVTVVIYLPKWIVGGVQTYKAEKIARKALTENVDKF